MIKKIYFIALIPVAIAFYFITRPSVVVDVTPAFYAPIVATVYATGVVESRVKAELSSLVSARLTKINVREGDVVTEGQVLVELDDREERAHVASLSAQLNFQEIELRRQTELAKNKFTSEQAKESVTAKVDQLRADLEAAKLRLAEHQLISPQAGVVLKADGDIGEVVQPGKVLVTIGQPDNLHIEAEIDEEGIPDIKKDQKVLIKADAYPGQIFKGTVTDITPLGDSLSKNYRVYIGFAEKVPFAVNMTVDCNIITHEKEKALLVPTSALKDDFLWKVVSGKLVSQQIKMGIRGDRFKEILEGVAEGDEIVTKPTDLMTENMKVRTREKPMNVEGKDR